MDENVDERSIERANDRRIWRRNESGKERSTRDLFSEVMQGE